jgi:hypothetical protein
MKLIQEAAVDDQFNVHIGKIQDMTQKLEDLAGTFSRQGQRPVTSQIRALERAAADLEALAAKYKELAK